MTICPQILSRFYQTSRCRPSSQVLCTATATHSSINNRQAHSDQPPVKLASNGQVRFPPPPALPPAKTPDYSVRAELRHASQDPWKGADLSPCATPMGFNRSGQNLKKHQISNINYITSEPYEIDYNKGSSSSKK